MSNDDKSFWTTLPGVLTAIATLLTAIGGLIAALHKSNTNAPQASPVSSVPASVFSVTAPASGSMQAVMPKGCQEAIGNWNWFIGGVVTIEKDGHMVWRKNEGDTFPTANGVWNCIDAQEREITLTWQQTNMTDTVKISKDGRSLSGSNYTGITVSGTKR